jgi:hypothetical protein
MTEHNAEDKRLNDYLSGKSPLSALYQQLPADAPNAHTDAAILAAAKHAHTTKPRYLRWALPAAIAAILLLGVSLLWWQQTQPPGLSNNTQSAAPAPEQTLPQQLDRTLHNNPQADQWLEQILKLHKAGKTVQAAKEFHRFRKAYPAYSMDLQRFGALQVYDK